MVRIINFCNEQIKLEGVLVENLFNIEVTVCGLLTHA